MRTEYAALSHGKILYWRVVGNLCLMVQKAPIYWVHVGSSEPYSQQTTEMVLTKTCGNSKVGVKTNGIYCIPTRGMEIFAQWHFRCHRCGLEGQGQQRSQYYHPSFNSAGTERKPPPHKDSGETEGREYYIGTLSIYSTDCQRQSSNPDGGAISSASIAMIVMIYLCIIVYGMSWGPILRSTFPKSSWLDLVRTGSVADHISQ